MVVLEEGGMLSTGHNQYLQPDYLSPLPTTLDAKKSPLALLAQTCSQIGADSPTKPLVSPLEKSTSKSSSIGGSSAKSPPAAKLERNTRGSPSDNKTLAFKPYETNVVTRKSTTTGQDEGRPTSKASVHSVGGQENGLENMSSNNNNNNNNSTGGNLNEKKSTSSSSSGSRTPVGRKSASPSSQATVGSSSSSVLSASDRKTPGDREKTDASPRNNGTSPIIRSGMEILSGGHAKDAAGLAAYKASIPGFATGNPLCCPPGLAENPAFRPPFAGASPFSHHHVAAAAALLGYPTPSPSPGNPYLSYARVKTPAGGEALVPVCKDPYCTGCQYSVHGAQLMMGAGAGTGGATGTAGGGGGGGGSAASVAGGVASVCPGGCSQCDHQKYGLAMALSSLGSMPPPPLAYPSTLTGGRPNMCNWIVGDSFCGKRFTTSDELLQHLRSHTSPTAQEPGSLLANPHHHPLLSPSAAALHRASGASYPAPSLSPLGARYHPYGKPPTAPLPASLAASPYSAFNALGPYYSPYAIYGQRIGAAVHP